MKEEWRNIKGYEGYYQVSNLGRIRSVKRKLCDGKTRRGAVVKGFPDRNGYYRIVLHKEAKMHRYMVHRLVASAFIDNPHNYPMINHIDEDKSNNAVTNLEWCDCKYNINYGTRTKRASGENTKNSKLTTDNVKEIRNIYIPKSKEFGAMALANKYGVSQSAIVRAVSKRNWKYID